VGLPARGKSFIARKLVNYLTWRGNQCRIFNVGKYRRGLVMDSTSTSTTISDTKTRNTNANTSSSSSSLLLPTEQQSSQSQPQPQSSPQNQQNADFFDESNHEATKLRQQAAQLALHETLEWLQGEDYSATGSSTGHESFSSDELTLEDHMPSHSSAAGGGHHQSSHRYVIQKERKKERKNAILCFNTIQCIQTNEVMNRVSHVLFPSLQLETTISPHCYF
jgi:hypothetical protein